MTTPAVVPPRATSKATTIRTVSTRRLYGATRRNAVAADEIHRAALTPPDGGRYTVLADVEHRDLATTDAGTAASGPPTWLPTSSAENPMVAVQAPDDL